MDAQEEALSALGWWQLAGVDVAVGDAPRDWLVTIAKRALPAAPAPETAAAPATLDAMRACLESDPLFGPGGERLLPEGDVASGLMLLADMPEPEDAGAGCLFSGEIGRMFDRMLAAIGRDRASIYLAAMMPSRPAGGRIDDAVAGRISALARDHVALAAPQLVLLLGQAPSRAILGMDLVEARGRIHHLNHGGATYAAIATFHPRFLFQRPAMKADAWRDLRLLLGEYSR